MHKSSTPELRFTPEMRWLLHILRRAMYLVIREIEKQLNLPPEETPFKMLQGVDKS